VLTVTNILFVITELRCYFFLSAVLKYITTMAALYHLLMMNGSCGSFAMNFIINKSICITLIYI
jgi:hypothetical protein